MTQQKPTDAEAVEALANAVTDGNSNKSDLAWAERTIKKLSAQGFEIVRVK